MKQIWRAVSHGVRRTLVHNYDGNTCTGATHVVQQMIRITEPNSNANRLVRVQYTVTEAIELANELRRAAAEAQRDNLYHS